MDLRTAARAWRPVALALVAMALSMAVASVLLVPDDVSEVASVSYDLER